MLKLDFFEYTKKIPTEFLRKKVLDNVFEWFIPFNKGMGLVFEEVSPEKVVVVSKNKRRQKNHVGGMHACALALMGEYAAGILVAQNFPFDRNRFIIGQLQVDYHKQGRGSLRAEVTRPEFFPKTNGSEGEFWVEMKTEITNEKGESVATVKTKWQVKQWSLVGKRS